MRRLDVNHIEKPVHKRQPLFLHITQAALDIQKNSCSPKMFGKEKS